MRRHTARDLHTDRRDLPLIGPHPRETVLGPRPDSQVGERRDQHRFDTPKVTDGVPAVGKLRYGDDRIPDELTGSVIGDVSASICKHKLSPDGAQFVSSDLQV